MRSRNGVSNYTWTACMIMLFHKIKKNAFLTLLISVSLLQGQNRISGLVTDVDDKPISFVNVVLNRADTLKGGSGYTLVKGTSTDDKGTFALENINTGNYIISFIYLGYHVKSNQLLVNDDLDLGAIKLEESIEALDETVVRSKRPTIRKEPGKLVFNVEGTSLATGNVVQLLTKTPGVLVQPESITIKNVKPIIYINDKRVYLSASEIFSLLTNTDASSIKAIEVITNPGAKYDAEGGSVLNIITSKAISIGYKGSINANYQQAVYPKYSFGTTHFYKNNWLSLTGKYALSPRKEFKKQEDLIRYFDPFVNVSSIWDVDFQRTTRTIGHQGSLNADFTIGDKNTLSASADIFVSPNTEYSNRVFAEIRNPEMQIDSTFTTISYLENNKSNLSFNLTHNVQVDEKGSSLKTALNYILYDDTQFQEVETDYFSPNGNLLRDNSFFTDAIQDSDILTIQTDLSVSEENSDFSMGLKYSDIDTKSGLDFFDVVNNASNFNPSLSDEFKYREYIYAAYLDYTIKTGSWGINAGLRVEQTDVEGTSVSLGVVNSQNYFELFPSLSIDHTLESGNTIGLSYARRISRPRYQSLNPFKYFLNENNFNSGNPNLNPSIDNKIKLSYNHKNKLFFDLYYHHTDNVLSILTFQDNVNRVIRSVDSNLIDDFQYSLDVLYASPITAWWYLSAYTSGFYFENEFFAEESRQETYSNSTFGFYGQVYNGFTLSNAQSLSLDLTAVYLSDFIFGSYYYGDQFNVSFSLQKKIWEGRGRITLGVDDIFNTYNIPISSRYYNQDNSYFPQPESRLFRLGFKYSFGNVILKENNRKIQSSESNRLKNQ